MQPNGVRLRARSIVKAAPYGRGFCVVRYTEYSQDVVLGGVECVDDLNEIGSL